MCLFVTATLSLPVSAVAGWNAGNIMSDAVFTNYKSMSASQIQQFLNSKVTSCDTNGQQNSEMNNSGVPDYNGNGSIQRWEWGKARYNQTTFPCLRDYSQNGKSAARLIYEAAQEYKINPQVLIVLLQKEQGLITDTWPLNIQYRSATGYGCPDTAPCDSQYYGLTNQLRWAATMFRAIQNDSPTWYTPYELGVNYIQYNPSASCGGSNVNIVNRTTQALYNYTPYQPNQGALNAGWGTATCGAYGNRNFYLYFTSWFGSTQTGGAYNPYAASFVSQSSYPTIAPGDSTTFSLVYRNTGSITWYDNTSASSNNAAPVRLATFNPNNRSSDFGDSWGGPQNRPTGVFETVYRESGAAYSTNPHAVLPGESVRIQFTLSTPEGYTAGTYREYFKLLVEGVGYMNTGSAFIDITVPEVLHSTFKGQSTYPTIKPGDNGTAYIEYTNTSNTNWYDPVSAPAHGAKAIVLVASSPSAPVTTDRSSEFGDDWPNSGNIASMEFARVYNKNGTAYGTNPHIAKPGESVRFNINFRTPDAYAAANYTEYFQPVQRHAGVNTEMGGRAWLRVTVPSAATAKPATTSVQKTFQPLGSDSHSFRFTNTGNTQWTRESTRLGVSGNNLDEVLPDDTDPLEAGSLSEATVNPGEEGTFVLDLSLKSPNSTASTLQVFPVVSGVDISLSKTALSISSPEARYSAQFYRQAAYPSIKQNSQQTVWFDFKNTGNVEWRDAESRDGYNKPVVLASTMSINRISDFNQQFRSAARPTTVFTHVYESDGETLSDNQSVVQPGQIGRFQFTLTAKDSQRPGTYREWFQPILEGGKPWDMGAKAFLNITVTDANYQASFFRQSGYPTLSPGESSQAYFDFKNTGNTTWTDKRDDTGIKTIHLATTNSINRQSLFTQSNRPTTTLAAVYEANGTDLASNQSQVLPGQIGRFEFTLTAPEGANPGTYREWFQPILEGGKPWDMGAKAFLDIVID